MLVRFEHLPKEMQDFLWMESPPAGIPEGLEDWEILHGFYEIDEAGGVWLVETIDQ